MHEPRREARCVFPDQAVHEHRRAGGPTRRPRRRQGLRDGLARSNPRARSCLSRLAAADTSGEAAGLLRLEAELPETLLPVQVTAPQPYPVRAQHVAPSPLAVTMDQQYLVRVTTAWRELAAMTSQFIFRTPRARASRAVRAPRPQPRRTVSGRDEALSGTTFTEDEVNWKVLAPLWSAVDKQVVVWYYDVDAAAAASTTEEEMVVFASAVASGSKSPGPCPKPLERSTVMEIRSWVFNDTQT